MKLPPQSIPDIAGVPARALQPDESTVLVGRGAAVMLDPAGGAVFLNGAEVLRNLNVCAATALSVTQYPVFVERALTNGVRERVFVPLKQAGAAWSWSAVQAGRLNIEWEWASRARATETSHAGVLQAGSVLLLCDRVVTWESTETTGRLGAQLGAGEALTLVVADCAGDSTGNSLRSFEKLPALMRSRMADAQRAREELLAVTAPTDWAERVNAAVYALHSGGVEVESVHDTLATVPIWLRSAAETVAQFFDTLGFAPDPEKHRAVLAPRLPADWSALEVRNLRMGATDALALRYDRSGSTHTFVLSPEAGAVPTRLVFEPAIEAANISRATVDGVAADLNYRRASDRVVCPLQVVLDHARTVVIEADQVT
jgi:hypothetical protein